MTLPCADATSHSRRTRRPAQPDLPGEESRVFLRDGSFESDVPVHQIGAHFGMSFAIVVQVDTAPSFTADALQHPG